MDTTKAIRPEMLNKIPEVSQMYYKLASKTTDRYKSDYYANCALFASKRVAQQETMKAHQKEIRSGTYTKDSGSVVAILQTGEMGISSNKLGQMVSGEDGEHSVISPMDNGREFTSNYLYETTPDVKFEFLLQFKKIAKMSYVTKLTFAWMLYNSGYVNEMTKDQRDLFRDEIRFLSEYDEDNKVEFRVLFEKTGIDRGQFRNAREYLGKFWKTVIRNEI
jgi:hypothetical protein